MARRHCPAACFSAELLLVQEAFPTIVPEAGPEGVVPHPQAGFLSVLRPCHPDQPKGVRVKQADMRVARIP